MLLRIEEEVLMKVDFISRRQENKSQERSMMFAIWFRMATACIFREEIGLARNARGVDV
jgi:hypothetical protein